MYGHIQTCSKQLSCSPEKGCVALSYTRASSTDSNIKGRKIKEPTGMGLPKPAVGPTAGCFTAPSASGGIAGSSSVPQVGLGHSPMEHLLQKRTKIGAGAPWALLTRHPQGACFQSPCSTVLSGPWWGFSLPSKPRRWRAEGAESSHLFPAFIRRGKKIEHLHFFLHLWVIKNISTTSVSPLPRITQVSPFCKGVSPPRDAEPCMH